MWKTPQLEFNSISVVLTLTVHQYYLDKAFETVVKHASDVNKFVLHIFCHIWDVNIYELLKRNVIYVDMPVKICKYKKFHKKLEEMRLH